MPSFSETVWNNESVNEFKRSLDRLPDAVKTSQYGRYDPETKANEMPEG
jgi:hypothetical protein